MDRDIGDLPLGDILVQDGTIRAVAPSIPPPPGALVLEGAGRIAMPGLVNGHIHLAQTMQRGLSTEHSFVTYFQQIVLRHSNRMTAADVRLADQAGALEQIAGGVTTVMDWSRETVSPDHADAAVEGLAAAGIRAILAYTTPPVPQGANAAEINGRMVAHARALLGRAAAGAGLALDLPAGPGLPAAGARAGRHAAAGGARRAGRNPHRRRALRQPQAAAAGAARRRGAAERAAADRACQRP
jgi:cytosine/adenosine deaminase-related metal-dependent hydrolase